MIKRQLWSWRLEDIAVSMSSILCSYVTDLFISGFLHFDIFKVKGKWCTHLHFPLASPLGAVELPQEHVPVLPLAAYHGAHRGVGHQLGQPGAQVHGLRVRSHSPQRGGHLLLADGAEGEDAAGAEELRDGDFPELAPVLAVWHEDDATARPPLVSARKVALSGRDANAASCVLSTSRAASRDDTTSVGTAPMRRSMTAPWRRARFRMARCGSCHCQATFGAQAAEDR
ncbi:hypothetical protein EJB05_21162 [Eragrostis curvula]|uniref:Uncharacterized protein n=1 Tax=Eragrostis curvula TaxID=38414 RepID=A0A5J9V290_9POAL|nr:hypothetical protein EJB05_21162 [Eragrostis curvula]